MADIVRVTSHRVKGTDGKDAYLILVASKENANGNTGKGIWSLLSPTNPLRARLNGRSKAYFHYVECATLEIREEVLGETW